MKVKQLIKELKKMPQNLDVEVAMFDNSEYETSGYVCSVFHFFKADYNVCDMPGRDQQCFEDMSDECVVIRC